MFVSAWSWTRPLSKDLRRGAHLDTADRGIRRSSRLHFRDGQLTLAATDLASHLGCRHLTQLNLRTARGELKRPHYNDPDVERRSVLRP
jgi:hypothetical protein